MEVRSDRRYPFDAEPGAVWAALTEVEAYPSWWPWLEEFDGHRVATGERWRCVVRPPVPYRVRFEITLDEVTVGTTVRAVVSGDIRGSARIDVGAASDGSGGSVVRLRAGLAPAHSGLQLLARFARPVVRYGHDWIIDSGARQFAAHVERAAASDPTDP